MATITELHPSLVKRIHRIRNLTGKCAYYIPQDKLLANQDLEVGSLIVIHDIEVENENRGETLISVSKYRAHIATHSVFLKDLAFPHKR